jgi:hypothetical protein
MVKFLHIERGIGHSFRLLCGVLGPRVDLVQAKIGYQALSAELQSRKIFLLPGSRLNGAALPSRQNIGPRLPGQLSFQPVPILYVRP